MDILIVFSFIAAGGGFLVATVALIIWLVSARRAGLAARMQSVQGTLVTIEPQYHKQQDGPDHWDIACRYEYTVDGKAYTGRRARLDFDTYPSEKSARIAIGDRRDGQAVTVWYDPSSPGRSSLDRTPPQHGGKFRVAAMIAAAIGVVGLVGMVIL